MISLKSLLRITVILLCSGFTASAEDSIQLDLKEAVRLALRPESQARLRTTENEKQLADARLALARSASALRVDGLVSQSTFRFDLRSIGVDLPQTSPFVVNVNLSPVVGPFSVLDTRMSAVKPLVDRSVSGQIATARDTVDAAKLVEVRVKEQIAAEVVRSYFNALFAASAVELAAKNVKQAEFAVGVEEVRKAQGLVTGAEVRRASLEVVVAQQKLASARADERMAKLQLLAMTGIDFNTQLVLTPLPPEESRVRTEQEALGEAMRSRPDWNGFQSQLKVLDSTHKAIEAQKLPTLAAFGNIGGLTVAPTPSKSELSSVSYTYTAGLALRIPVLDGGRRAAQLTEVEVRRREVESAKRQMQKQVELQVRVAVEKLRSAEEQMKMVARQQVLTQEDIAQTRSRFEAGEASGLELREALARSERTNFQHLLSVHEWNLARLGVGEATGTVLEFRW